MGEKTPHIDSRYSAIYQRGGAVGPAHQAGPAPQGTHWPIATEPPRQRPASAVDAQAYLPPEDPAKVVEVLPEGAAQPSGSHPMAGKRINPFVLGLWFLGAALLALGLWAVFAPLQVDETAVGETFPQWIFIISQSAGGIVVSGSILLTTAGGLSAVFWDRRRH